MNQTASSQSVISTILYLKACISDAVRYIIQYML
jgi:hypothetical protein